MSFLSKIEKFLRRDLWLPELETLRGWASFYIRTLRLIVVAFSDFRDGALSIRATSLVSTTLLSLVPFLAVTFSVLKAFGIHEQVEPFLAQGLEPLGEKGIELTAKIIEFVNNLKVGALGAVGVAGLFYTTYSLIDKIEEALNHIWRVRQARPLARKFTDYLSVILVGPVLVFTAFATTASAQSYWLFQSILKIEPLGVAVVWATTLMPFLLICVGFSFLYKFVPHTDVQISSALMGGVTAGILWQIAGMLFATFVAGANKYSAIYSSFAILILFLMWVYVGWLIVLIGAQVGYYHQHPAAYLTRLRWKQNTAAFREHLALTMLVQMTRRYLAQEPPYREAELATKLGVPLSAQEEIVEDFIDHGLVYRTVDPKGLMLGKPPEQVTVLEILQLVSHREYPPVTLDSQANDPVGALLRLRDQATLETLNGMTLKMLAEEEPAALAISEPSTLLVDQPVS
ncbi:MAG: YihY family inner membrane protein [Nitrospirae bacterium]|nr:YihY family inner membrane protein [Nitrospirota bacterium]MDA1305262.1 YihY family inner membrane protein [Nitrospirota bacterium]